MNFKEKYTEAKVPTGISKLKMISVMIALIMVCALVLNACDLNSGEDDLDVDGINFDVGTDYTDEIKIWVQSSASELKIINAFAESFKVKYKNIKVTIETIEATTYNGALQRASSTPANMPDLFWVTPENISMYRDYGILAPLNDIIDKDKDFKLDNIAKAAVDSCSDGGKLYVMPRDYNQVVMYYNVDMFNAAGVDYPSATEAMSQEAFLKMCSDLKTGLKASEQKNQYGYTFKEAFTNVCDVSVKWDSFAWPILKNFGGAINSAAYPNGQDASDNLIFDSQETRNAMQFLNTASQNSYIGKPSTYQSKDGSQFLLETAPVYFHVRAVLTNIIDAQGSFKGIKNLGTAPFPNLGLQDNYFVGSGSTGYGINKNTSHLVGAWLFLEHMVSEAAQEAACVSGNIVPCIDSLINDEKAAWQQFSANALGENFNNSAYVYKRDTVYTHVREFMQYIDPAYQSEIFGQLQSCIQDCIENVSGANTIATHVNKWAKEMNKYLRAS